MVVRSQTRANLYSSLVLRSVDNGQANLDSNSHEKPVTLGLMIHCYHLPDVCANTICTLNGAPSRRFDETHFDRAADGCALQLQIRNAGAGGTRSVCNSFSRSRR